VTISAYIYCKALSNNYYHCSLLTDLLVAFTSDFGDAILEPIFDSIMEMPPPLRRVLLPLLPISLLGLSGIIGLLGALLVMGLYHVLKRDKRD
jgi:hypothetical protein